MFRRTNISFILLTIILELIFFDAQSQYVLKQAEHESTLYNYTAAIPLYEKAYKKKPTVEAARGAAEAYYKQGNFISAEAWYAKVVSIATHSTEDEFHYAQTLMCNARY